MEAPQKNIVLIPALSDNYIYGVHDGERALIVDPAEADPVLDFLQRESLDLEAILITHHHFDHIGGIESLKKNFYCRVIAPKDERIPLVDEFVEEGSQVHLLGLDFQVLETPGHTKTHVAFYSEAIKALFCGDTLFAGGCGRLLEGTASEMYASLQKLNCLPGETCIYCGHEYTLKNLRFALSVEPDNQALQERVDRVERMREQGAPSLPCTLEEERKTNPFLRSPDQKTFQERRKNRDRY